MIPTFLEDGEPYPDEEPANGRENEADSSSGADSSSEADSEESAANHALSNDGSSGGKEKGCSQAATRETISGGERPPSDERCRLPADYFRRGSKKAGKKPELERAVEEGLQELVGVDGLAELAMKASEEDAEEGFDGHMDSGLGVYGIERNK